MVCGCPPSLSLSGAVLYTVQLLLNCGIPLHVVITYIDHYQTKRHGAGISLYDGDAWPLSCAAARVRICRQVYFIPPAL